ncbi:hypothetical protein IWX49DRAFT_263370 [Phyllosticta citricarpa]|uniref:Uncharacterized protein n=1 Tax=Phyllosticta citricarpa TaxID=55181 RepID=A0ABR1LKG4_9PEZI
MKKAARCSHCSCSTETLRLHGFFRLCALSSALRACSQPLQFPSSGAPHALVSPAPHHSKRPRRVAESCTDRSGFNSLPPAPTVSRPHFAMVNPLVPSKNQSSKRTFRRSPDSGVLPAAKKQKVDDASRYQAEQASCAAGVSRPGPLSKPPSPVEAAMDPRRTTSTAEYLSDPRRRQSEQSSDPRRRPREPNPNSTTQAPAEDSIDPESRRPSRPSVPMAPMGSKQLGGMATPITHDASSPSVAQRKSYFEPATSRRQKQIQHEIADTQSQVCSLSMARNSAKEAYDPFKERLGSMTALLKAQADVARIKLEELEAELKQEQDKLHQLIDEEYELREQQWTSALDGIYRQFPQISMTKPTGKTEPSEVSEMVESKLDARMTGYKASIKLEMGSVIDKKLADERLKSDSKDEMMKMVDARLEARMTENKASIKAEITPVVDQKLADQRLSLQADMTTVMDKKLADERATRSQRLQSQDERVEALQAESWELQKAGLSVDAVKRWCKSLAKYETRIKTLEETNTQKRSPPPDLQKSLSNQDDKIKALEGNVEKDLRPELSRLDAKTKALAEALQRLGEAGSLNDLRSDFEQLKSRVKALEEGHTKLEEACAANDLRSDLEELKLKSPALEKRIEKLNTSSNGHQEQFEKLDAKTETLRASVLKLETDSPHHLRPDLQDLRTKAEALEDSIRKLEQATSSNASNSDVQQIKSQTKALLEDIRDLKKATQDTDVHAEVQTLKSQSQLHAESIARLQKVNSPSDLLSSIQKLEAKVEATSEVASNDARQFKNRMDSLRELEENVLKVHKLDETVQNLQGFSHKFSTDIEWIRRCIDHRSDDFFRMPLYDAMCRMLKLKSHEVTGRFDDAAPQALATIPPDFKAYLDPDSDEYKESPLGRDLKKRFESLKAQMDESAGDLDDRLKELEDKVEDNDREGDLWDDHVKLENQVAALNDKSHILPEQVKELSRKFDQLRQDIEALPAHNRELDQKIAQLDRNIEQLPLQVKTLTEQMEQVRSRCNNPENANATGTMLSQDAIQEVVTLKIRENNTMLEAQAKSDGRYLKKKLFGLVETCEGLQQDVRNLQNLEIIKTGHKDISDLKNLEIIKTGQKDITDLQNLEIIKTGQRNINVLIRYFRDFQDSQMPSIIAKISALENSTSKFFPVVMDRTKQQDMSIDGVHDEIGELQVYVASMAKRFVPAHSVPAVWERRQTPAEQGVTPGAPRLLPARPPSAVQGHYRQQL